jgi:succinate dehydrogenase / fumarate reductase, iron-sulfur subunit
MTQTFTLKIFRGEPGHQYWEEFLLDLKPSMNVISALMEIQKNPVTSDGKKVTPVVWESNCLEEVCGSCSMLINGYPRQACTALIEPILQETRSSLITLAPFTKFPLIRDLMVDRSSMFDNLKKIKGWIEVDDARDPGAGPKIPQSKQEIMYTLSTCMTCGCCSEGCPQVNKRSAFIGPAPVAQVRLFNIHPIGKFQAPERLRPLMEAGGISECGNAQNCVRVCPKHIPLTDAIASIGRDVTIRAIKDLFSLPERD